MIKWQHNDGQERKSQSECKAGMWIKTQKDKYINEYMNMKNRSLYRYQYKYIY